MESIQYLCSETSRILDFHMWVWGLIFYPFSEKVISKSIPTKILNGPWIWPPPGTLQLKNRDPDYIVSWGLLVTHLITNRRRIGGGAWRRCMAVAAALHGGTAAHRGGMWHLVTRAQKHLAFESNTLLAPVGHSIQTNNNSCGLRLKIWL